jgi:hypothetical protein
MSTEQPAESSKPIRINGIEIPHADQSPLVLALIAVIQKQDQEIQELRDEIQRMKKTIRRPKIEPSRLLKPPPDDPAKSEGKRPGSAKRKKTKDLRIDVETILTPPDLPEGAKLGLSFHEYLRDRLRGEGAIPLLSKIMRRTATSTVTAEAAIKPG